MSRVAGTKAQWRALERELAAVIDYHLHQPEPRREDSQYVDGLFTLLRQAIGAIERAAR